jgi:hypothetical protein
MRGQPRHEVRQMLPQQRFSAGDAQLVDAETDEHADQPIDLFEGQDVGLGQPGVLGLGHAVLTPQVAAVGDRQAQVAQRALEGVDDHGGQADQSIVAHCRSPR